MAPNATLPVRENYVSHSRGGTKHVPFQSIYRPDFQVVEQREGRTTMFPHTEQLPVLLRALNLEFYGALPSRLARTDHRAEDYRKVSLQNAALLYCSAFNAARPDGVRLIQLPDHQRVSKLSIVQQVTEHRRLGRSHYFRFYAGPDFFPEILLNGKRVMFSEHTLQRFSSRVPNPVGTDLSEFLLTFFGSAHTSLPVPHGRAFIMAHNESLLAFTYKETETEYFVTTCLTVNELHGLKPELPTRAHNFHYELPFTSPRVRHWLPFHEMCGLFQRFRRKTRLTENFFTPHKKVARWFDMAGWMLEEEKRGILSPGTRLEFLDGIPGPNTIQASPKEVFGAFDETEILRQMRESHDWERMFKEQHGIEVKVPDELMEKHWPLEQMAA